MHRADAHAAPTLDAFCTTGTSPTGGARPHDPGGAPAPPDPGATVAASSGVIELPAGRLLERGELPAEVRIRHELVGPRDAPLVVVLGGISAGCHVAASPANPAPGWWDRQVGDRGQALDTRRVRVLSADFLGASPDGDAPRAWPAVTTGDQADLLARVLDAHGEDRASLLVGASYGGMVGLSFAARHPRRVGRLLCIAAAHRPHPMATAWRSLQRRIVRLGLDVDRPADALAIARGLAMTTYRSIAEFEQRFAAGPGGDGVAGSGPAANRPPVERYLRARGRSFARDFCPGAFLRLSESIDLHDVDPGRVPVPVGLVAFDTDRLVPPWLVEELAASLPGPVELHRLPSIHGHDAFLTDTETVAAVLRAELEGAAG